MRSLTDKIAVVTGAASGIGQATAIEFADKGADVVVSDVNEAGLAETVSAIEAKGRKAMALGVDVSKPEQIEGMINKTIDTFGRIDILMNNAGVGLSGEMRHLSLQDWEWIMGINLWGPIYGIHFALPHMVKQKERPYRQRGLLRRAHRQFTYVGVHDDEIRARRAFGGPAERTCPIRDWCDRRMPGFREDQYFRQH